MTVDHYAEAREQAITILADAIRYQEDAAAALDTLLAAKLSTECPTCGGRGYDNSPPKQAEGYDIEPCPDCNDGRIEGGSLVILAPEQVGWVLGDPISGFRTQQLGGAAANEAPVYRERPVQEEK